MILDIDPAVPHNLVYIVGIFRYSQRVDHTAASIVLRATAMSLCIGEYNLGTAGIHASSSAWALTVEIIPTTHKFHCKLILIMVICGGILAFMQWAIT